MGIWKIALILTASLIAGVFIYSDVISDLIVDANFLHLLQMFLRERCFLQNCCVKILTLGFSAHPKASRRNPTNRGGLLDEVPQIHSVQRFWCLIPSLEGHPWICSGFGMLGKGNQNEKKDEGLYRRHHIPRQKIPFYFLIRRERGSEFRILAT